MTEQDDEEAQAPPPPPQVQPGLFSEPRKSDRIFKGRAVRAGRLIYTSVSQVKLFDPESDGCPRKWAFQYVFGKKPLKTDAQRRGTDFASKLEHFLKTGEDVLPPVLQQARKFFPAPGADLEVERPMALPDGGFKDGGFLRAIEAREAYLRTGDVALLAEVKRWAGLAAAGVPLEGAADFRHFRGEFIDEGGELVREPAGAVVCETVDLKTTSRIDSHKIKRGESAGKILPGRAKTAAEVCEDHQMVEYAQYVADREPQLTHLRLSHIYSQTEGKKAVKRTGIISVETVRRRHARVEAIVREMDQAAGAARVEDVEPNLNACDAFTHVDPADGKSTLRGCPHRYYCPLSQAQVSVSLLGPQKESAMSLFDQLSIPTSGANGVPPAPVAPVKAASPAPVFDEAARAAEVEAHKRRMLEEDALGSCPACGAKLTLQIVSRLRDGTVKHVGCAHAPASPPAPAPAAPPPPVVFNPSAVVPPDAPVPALLDRAAPLPQSEIDKITDPELRKKVEEHAAQHKAIADAEERREAESAGSVWCPGGNRRIQIDVKIALDRKFKCECGKEIRVRPAQEGEDWFATISKHKPLKVEGATAPPAASAPITAPPPPSPAPPVTTTPPPPPGPPPSPAPTTVPAQPVASAVARDFGEALAHLKQGRRVSRAGWNGQGMYLFLWTPDVEVEGEPSTLPYVVIHAAGGERVPWLASQADVLATDWQMVE